MNRITKQALSLLRKAKRAGTWSTSLEQALRLLTPPKKSDKAKAYGRAARAKDAKKIAAHRISTGEIRAAVMERARRAAVRDWYCEAAPFRDSAIPHVGPMELDHWLSGNGRRRSRQSVETCWLLCRRCHMDRTANAPDAATWNAIRKLFCVGYGYPFTPHIEKATLPRRTA